MATLRLFAQAREAAGTGSIEIDATTVDGVLAVASDRLGPAFSDLLGTSRVWVNGAAASGSDTVSSSDEVAVLPPVSGG